MIINDEKYDVAIIGGGLAGLSLACCLSEQGYRIILFEREQFPFHKVCGEYISMESYPFLERLGLNLSALELPVISNLKVSSVNGKYFESKLDLGGFGISRFLLDELLAKRVVSKRGEIKEKARVTDLKFTNDKFLITVNNHEQFQSKLVIGAFGKRSNIDKLLNRPFMNEAANSKKNYVGIKYHIKSDLPKNQIELHNFQSGYAGISAIEENKFCLCYLTTAENLKKSGGKVEVMEKEILSRNPFLKKYLNQERLYDSPLSISQVSFRAKSTVEDHILMTGDSAGLITPVCGNGMSMALRASFILSELLPLYLKHIISREELEKKYSLLWKKEFQARLFAGRFIQNLMEKPATASFSVSMVRRFPKIADKLISLTHGKEF